MSVINNSGLAPGFAASTGLPAFTVATAQNATPGVAQSARADNIQVAPYQATQPDAYGPDPGDGYDQGTGGFAAMYNQLLGTLSSLFSNLGSMFASPANPTTTPVPSQPTQRGQGQAFFTSASANSVGDPHETFTGTTATGATIDQKWDSMTSHPNLLDSNSFDGGYRVSTAVTAPNSAGITQNQSASVTTSGGAAKVTMNQDGSYSVTSNGQNLRLPTGQPQQLGNGETVTLNADSSLTVVDQNASGGCITTTLKANGTGGVDVTNDAKNVDLGGSLFGHAEYRAGIPPTGGPPNDRPYTTLPLPGAPAASAPLSSLLERDLAIT